MENSIEIRLLGAIELSINGEQIELPTRSLHLLAYLLLKPNQSHYREKLAGELWPSANRDNALAYLRNALWQIRRELGTDFIISSRSTLAINQSAPLDLDFTKFEGREWSGSTIEELASILACFRGELLPGFYDDWVIPERARVTSAADQVFKTIVTKCLDQGRGEEAATWSEKWIYQLGPNEAAYRSLMKSRAALADIAGLTAAYQRCINDLRHQLGVDPSDETRALYHSLINGEYGLGSSNRPDASGTYQNQFMGAKQNLVLILGLSSILLLFVTLSNRGFLLKVPEDALTQVGTDLGAHQNEASITTCPLGDVSALSAPPRQDAMTFSDQQVLPSGQGQLTIVALDGSAYSTVSPNNLFVSDASWTRNGLLLVLADPRGDLRYRGGGDFYLINPSDGTVISQITYCADNVTKGSPVIAPDHEAILFSDGNGISILHLDDGWVETVVPHNQLAWTFSADWSPAGDQIAYLEITPPCDPCNTTARIIVVNQDGSGSRVLYESHGDEQEGIQIEVNSIGFSPDGEYIGFIEHGLMKINLIDGTIQETSEWVWSWLPSFYRYDPPTN